MGCYNLITEKDLKQMRSSLAKGLEPDTWKGLSLEEKTEKFRSTLNRASSKRILSILFDPKHPAYMPLSRHLAKSIKSQMTQTELQKLPEVFRTILNKHPNAMGLFEKAPSHRGPGASAVQHHYEIFSAAALTSGSYRTVRGKILSIGPGDRVDFGIKFARGYAQPKRYGTIEADILVGKSSIMSYKTVAIDAKYAKTGNYGAKEDLQRQLDGIRTGFRDGKVDEFYFVTNGKFGDRFKDMVKAENLKIARDYAKSHNRLYHDEKHGIDTKYLTREERESIPPGKMPKSFFSEDNEKVREFVNNYEVPQIDLCEHVKYPET